MDFELNYKSTSEEINQAGPDPWTVPMPKTIMGHQMLISRDSEKNTLDAHTTTVIIKNIACRCKFHDAMQILDSTGLTGTYDFFYLPMNRAKTANLGFCFVNFTKPEHAVNCSLLLTGQPFGSNLSHKRCEVAAAHVQGYSRMVLLFNRKAVMRSKLPPLFIDEGVPLTPEHLANTRREHRGLVYRL